MDTVQGLNKSISWETWKKRWVRAKDLPTVEGLLHCVFSTEIEYSDEKTLREKSGERLRFVLDLAEGWIFDPPGENLPRQKAVKVLADHFFKKFTVDRIKENYDAKTVQAIVEFLKDPSNVSFGHRASGYPGDAVREAFLSLCRFAWGHTGPLRVWAWIDDDAPYDWVSVFTRLDVMEAMHRHEKVLTLLPQTGAGQYAFAGAAWETITPDLIDHLESLILAEESSVEEAFLRGRSSANALVLMRFARTEIDRRAEEKARQAKIAEHQKALQELGATTS